MGRATKYNYKVLNGLECPYCGAASELVDSSVIYGKSYGMIYLCSPCDAYVGVHKGWDGKRALGSLANKELREARKKAHSLFDPIWKNAIKTGWDKYEARKSAYRWLSYKMSIPDYQTHIGMFDVEQCKRVVEIITKKVVDVK